ncbi:glycogen synthase [Candidatus Scalindua japonica]|uniref:Glycogen synthase n=1 Tax=Candidatus Scalindua japonica TaxID=1284222 RepID=A0A286TXF0_9BACT|nr:glycogen synthase GlgA [Candidatus Scalindua japonica]GAX60534.1 glycogen synthase [Candidatus Scalindua japonica]
MKIAEVSPEIIPYAKTGGLADVVGTLPLYLEKAGHEVSIFMPFYKSVKNSGIDIKLLDTTFDIPIGDTEHTVTLWKSIHHSSKNIVIYFIQRDEYFDRDSLYGTEFGDYQDNAERFIFFSRAVIEAIKRLVLPIDIIHCHDWQTALIPIYLKTLFAEDEKLSSIKTVLTIHNLAYQGMFRQEEMKLTGLDMSLFNCKNLEHWNNINFLKGGIVFADIVTTVSKKYAEEIRTIEFGCGLEGVIEEHEEKLYGIINGVDYTEWSPDKDDLISHQFSIEDIKGKAQCKKHLQNELDLPQTEAPLLGMISRLAEQKGVDLLIVIMDELMKRDLQLVILGIGDEKYHQMLKEFTPKYSEKLSVNIMFDNKMAHQIEAGADIFLMPSKYEPCGLNQMYSLKYGTIPIVRETGGLADTIIDANDENLKNRTATGFTMKGYFAAELLHAIDRALDLYKLETPWKALRENAMKQDWSWEKSTNQYIELFKSILK